MQKLASLAVLPFFLSGINSYAQKPSQLYNGKNLNGWYAFDSASGKHKKANELFQASDNMIRMFGPEAGYLMSKKSYNEFELTAEFRWNTVENFTRKNNKKNSGLMYLVPESAKDTLWPQGIQFQIKEGSTGDFILLQNVTLEQKGTRNDPGRSVVLGKDKDAEMPTGEWNKIRIRVESGKVSQYLNGELVNEGIKPSVNNGRILLQYEGFPIDFRNIEITKL
ncbi:3-keto-disaccharide hydrolase [Mangrovibacterium lignilyticum]|uniref:3-keto-disaccharide hydrolase n=1 Tax=Mangrovibacterium lignilyticum TaxID=2668052 RepID=UPI0013D1E94D|nr:DUF1080 domain-containing protein [Mangrovibacterium lignilyticum]